MTQNMRMSPFGLKKEYNFSTQTLKNGTIVVTYSHDNGKPFLQEKIDVQNWIISEQSALNDAGKAEGLYKSFHENAALAIDGTRNANGIFIGNYLEFYDNNQVHVIGTRTDRGVFVGQYFSFYKNGQADEALTLNLYGDFIGDYQKYNEKGNLMRNHLRDNFGNVIEEYPVDAKQEALAKEKFATQMSTLNALFENKIMLAKADSPDMQKTQHQIHINELLLTMKP